MGKSTLIGASVLAAAMFMAVSAQAGKPQPFINSCTTFQGSKFYDLCEINRELAINIGTTEEDRYIGSCEDVNKCAASVLNKLESAKNKDLAGKKDDAVANICTIFDDAKTWADPNGRKPKLTEEGKTLLTAEANVVAGLIKGGATCD